MSTLERLIAALEASPEVRPGTARQLVADLVADVLNETPLFLAEYDSVESEVFLNPDDARAMCDDIAQAVANGQCWDWSRNEHGVYVQFWTHEDDDRPLHLTGGTVTEIRVQRPAAEAQEKDNTREGESTQARRSATRLAAFFDGAHKGGAREELTSERLAEIGDLLKYGDSGEKDTAPAATSTPQPAEERIVAYRNTHRPGVLLCREHGDGWAWLTPLTSDDLPDGGICTHGDPADPDDVCGVDVLIDAPRAGQKDTREGASTPDFFQPGHSYAYEASGFTAPELLTVFRVASTTVHPATGEPFAFGWIRKGEATTWVPYAEPADDWPAAWSEITEGGDAR
ncbi:hypothetical protein [Streptomyces sp. NBC_00829]|uniref:hypothetical protein n=1 Tax=Streptomyces sp. NBC_00829 TaxID=2903679 RepID=UPI0038634C6C|nr:hypothetical protein OG293_23355 [Streptomyces sp. NBC_00829]